MEKGIEKRRTQGVLWFTVVVVFTLKTVLTSTQYPSFSFFLTLLGMVEARSVTVKNTTTTRQRNEFPCHKLNQNKQVQENNDKIK